MAKSLKNLVHPDTKQILNEIYLVSKKHNLQTYVVGGFVRDLIIKKAGKDIDFVVLGDAIEFAQNIYKTLFTSAPVLFPKFGTAMLQLQDYHLEFVNAREEIYTFSSRKPKVKKTDLFSDLSRRDFTINTLAMEISPDNFGNVVDHYNGISDIKEKIIRTPLEPENTFYDDPLRMMRAIRFATSLDFSIETKTLNAIKNVAPRLDIISQERITDEFNKILMSPIPSKGLELLDSSNLLDEFLPELKQTLGIEQKYDCHHKDVFYHTLQVIDQISKQTNNLKLRLAALFHDIAKPKTKRFSEKNGWTFHGHEVVGERMTDMILKRMKYSNEIRNHVKKMVRLHLRPMALVSEEVTDSAIRRLLFLAGEDFDDLMVLCRADITSKNPKKIKQYLKNYEIVVNKAIEVEGRDRLRAFKSPIDGIEIMQKFNLAPGPIIGKIKKIIRDAILDGSIPNEHSSAWKFLNEKKEELLK
jgi:putative nucleotidyltransferase with HDIG domain